MSHDCSQFEPDHSMQLKLPLSLLAPEFAIMISSAGTKPCKGG